MSTPSEPIFATAQILKVDDMWEWEVRDLNLERTLLGYGVESTREDAERCVADLLEGSRPTEPHPERYRAADRYRVGEHYGIHVYAVDPTSPSGDRPVATFHNEGEAARFVAAMNYQLTKGR